jgi:hypothetical protein
VELSVGLCTYRWIGSSYAIDWRVATETTPSIGREGLLFTLKKNKNITHTHTHTLFLFKTKRKDGFLEFVFLRIRNYEFQITWQWLPFTSSARKDNLQLYHWVSFEIYIYIYTCSQFVSRKVSVTDLHGLFIYHCRLELWMVFHPQVIIPLPSTTRYAQVLFF